jgi:DNA-binding CsgD family transcriptional regulator
MAGVTRVFKGRLGAANGEYAVISYPLRRPGQLAKLTAAELAVSEGVLEGLSMRQLAQRRQVSERTIGNQLASIYRKLGVASRHELLALLSGSNSG